ncbi:MAG: acyl carrier protein [Oscillospiraceae bacterium]|nr:acyl carrier protein [Oscillospiraceae bacterium]
MFDTLKDLICRELGVEEDQITPETDFVTDLHCDSLELIELTNVVEEEFELDEIPEEELVLLKTVGDLFRYIEENVKES